MAWFRTRTSPTRSPATMSGSDPAAYALLNSPRGATVFDSNAAIAPSTATSASTIAGGALPRIPALANLEEQDLSQERLGLTTAFQWKPTPHTLVNLDLVYSKFTQASEVNQIQSVGL